MEKSPDAFRSIGEVSRLVGVAPHVLRYWESQFSQLSPVKRSDGRRYYRPEDVRLVAGLCQVMREEGMSIRGAKRLIAADRGAGLRQIGALRLGEAMGESSAEQSTGPAVRLALPEAATVALAPATTAQPAMLATAEAETDDAPFPDEQRPAPWRPTPDADRGDWLDRLGHAATLLRRQRSHPLPAAALTALRDARTGAR
jgi:DNA-binding transcriptional MerR regulator